MRPARSKLSPQEMRARAEAWFDKQMVDAERAHGHHWPEHRDWVAAYLREEIRERLVANGWRPMA